jgi:hypothetical protein
VIRTCVSNDIRSVMRRPAISTAPSGENSVQSCTLDGCSFRVVLSLYDHPEWRDRHFVECMISNPTWVLKAVEDAERCGFGYLHD